MGSVPPFEAEVRKLSLEALLRKYLWVVDLVAVSLCALFLARAAAGLVDANLAELPVPPPKASPLDVDRATAVNRKDVLPILKRNVFCSECPPILKPPAPPKAVAEKASGAAVAPIEKEPVATKLPLELVAVMYAEPPLGMTYSAAVLRETENGAAGSFGVGESFLDAKIIGIEETRVFLDNNGNPEFLDLLAEDAPKKSKRKRRTPKPAAKPKPKKRPKRKGIPNALSKALDEGIREIGPNKYEIQRQTLQQVLGNMNLLSRSARIVPEVRDGQPAGFRLYSVKPEGPFAKIGMQNGDVIFSINGLEMTSPEKALMLYTKLKSAAHLSVGLERNGKRTTKDYAIR